MYFNPIVLIYPSSHLSFWLAISLFDKSVSVFFCGNMFMGSHLRITFINDIVGYLSYPFDLLNLIWLFLGSTVVLKTALFIFFPRLLFHLVRIPLRLCRFICLWTFFFASMSLLFQYCCSAHLPASVFPILVVLGYRPKRCPAASYGSSIFTFSSSSIQFALVLLRLYIPPAARRYTLL